MKVLVVDGVKEERARIVAALSVRSDLVIVGAVARLPMALHVLGDTPPDVLVTDARIGDDDATALIAAAHRCIAPPMVVVFSSEDSADVRQRCSDAGADRFVAKAAGLEILERTLVDAYEARTAGAPDRFALIGRVAAGVAHDLNNYLGVIDMSLARMRKRLAEPMLADDLLSIRRALDTSMRLSSNMARYARGSSPPYGFVDLGTVVQRVLDLFQRTLPNSVLVEAHFDNIPRIEGNELELEQLVLNLLLNAAVASQQGGDVIVRLKTATSGRVQLVIEDRGEGLAAVVTTDDAVVPSAKGGDGLGLGIVRHVARRHAATLHVAPVHPTGTRVTVELDAKRSVS